MTSSSSSSFPTTKCSFSFSQKPYRHHRGYRFLPLTPLVGRVHFISICPVTFLWGFVAPSSSSSPLLPRHSHLVFRFVRHNNNSQTNKKTKAKNPLIRTSTCVNANQPDGAKDRILVLNVCTNCFVWGFFLVDVGIRPFCVAPLAFDAIASGFQIVLCEMENRTGVFGEQVHKKGD